MPQNRAPQNDASAGYHLPDVSPVSGVPSQGTYFLGRYRIIDEIGLGGMASVHLARVDGIGGFQRWFAVKRIHAHLVEDETFVNMFLDEANVAARITHPNVATVFELGRHDDTYWIAMEYLHGEPLREVMRRTEEMGTTMPPEIACRVISEAADGLHAAHELQGKDGEKLNLIHRDVTPHNLFVTYEGVTKVVDFGIAKFQDRMASTQAGTLKGKLAYMSPEQVQGESIDRRTDIFALGVVLWELTTGQRLFRMDSDLDTLAKVQECNIPPPSTMVRGYPLDLEKILMQALAKNRNDRFPTAREFSRALQSLLTRRGLFIASDEVAAYMASIFVDRMVKREEHLRWASAVSDAAAAAAGGGAPPAQAPRAAQSRAPTPPPPPAAAPAARGAPRPAAGAPAARTSSPGQPPLARPATVPFNLSPVAASPQARGPNRPLAQTVKQDPPLDEDDEDRTVQATPAQQAEAHAAYARDFDDDNDATIVSRSAPSDSIPPTMVRSPVVPAAGMPAPGRNQAPLPAFPSASQQPPPRTSAAPGPPIPGGARAMPANANLAATTRQSQTGGPQYKTQMGLQPQPAPRGAPQGGGFAPGGVPAGFNITDPSLPVDANSATVPPGRLNAQQPGWPPPPPGAAPSPYGPPPQQQYGMQQAQPYGAPGNYPQGPNSGGNGFPPPPPFPGQGYPNQPGQPAPAYAAPPGVDPRGQPRPVIAPKRLPPWAVAVAAGVVALMFAGALLLMYALFHTTSKPDAPVAATGSGSGASQDQTAQNGSGTSGSASPGNSATSGNTPSPGSSSSPPGQGGSDSPGGTGLFAAARAGFLAAATPPPMTTTPPPPAPVPSPVAAAAPPPAPTPDPVAAQPAPPPPAAAAPTPRAAEPAPAPAPVAATPHYQPATTPVAPSGGGAAGPKGFLSVICIPGCDRVELDGQSLGASPVFKHSASVGSHRVKLVSSNPPGTKVVSTIVVAGSTAMVRESMP